MNWLQRVVLLGWLATLPVLSVAQNSQAAPGDRVERLTEAVDAYRAAQELTSREARLAAFARSERLFASTAELGQPNAELLLNQGNAALQAERLGQAVAAYRAALAIDPGHPTARQNLDHARSLLPEWVPKPVEDSVVDTLFFWQRSVSAAQLQAATAIGFLVLAALVAVTLALRSRTSRAAAWLAGLVWLGLLGSTLVKQFSGSSGTAAVVIADEVIARAADSFNAARRFQQPLPAGTELDILERRDQWTRVRLANGREAWLPASAIATIAG